MKIQELINKLKQFPPNLDITITDGFKCNCYNTNSLEFQVLDYSQFYNDKNKTGFFVDIGIGGCDE